MKISVKYLLIVLVIVLLTSSGCDLLRRNPDMDHPIAIDYHKGTEGLTMKFVKNLPPKSMMEGEMFNIGLELGNEGTHDIQGGKIHISGFDKSYISLTQAEINFDIEGKKPGFPEGGYDIINFEAKNIEIPEIQKSYKTLLRVIANYRYETEAGAEICINPYIYSYVKTKETVCTPETLILKNGQGAPVTITKIESSFTPLANKIKARFNIYIANKGEGEVIDQVYINDVKLANVPINCLNDVVELKDDKEKSVVCSTEIPLSEGSYISPISINLVYDYTSKLDTTLEIKSLT